MDQRYSQLLCELVAHHIRTGRPVGSSALTKRLNWQVSPATVRTMLQQLTDEGYVYQPHTSAGRVPTDRGYRFYVDHIKTRLAGDNQLQELIERYQQLNHKYRRRAQALAKLLAQMSRGMAITMSVPDDEVEQAGASYLFEDVSHDLAAIREAINFSDHVDQYSRQLTKRAHPQTTVFIGSENPYSNAADHTSLLIRTISKDASGTTVISIIGPKRMPYQKNIAALENVARALEQL